MINQESSIIIIEDDRELLEVMSLVLSDEGYSVESYNSPQFTYKDMNNKRHLFIIDAWIGNEKMGVNQAKYLNRFYDDGDNCKVIMISGDYSIENEMNFTKNMKFLPKPFELDDFLNLVNTSLN